MKGIGMRVRELFPATLGLLVMAGSATAAPDAEQRIRAFFAATERQDVEQMVEAVSEDFRWMQIDDQQLSVEVVGREQLRSWLQGYFSSTPGLHTELLDLQIDGNYVSLIERVAWADDNGRIRTYSDIYGHEKRITQALQGKWSEINVGRNHLAPVGEAAPPSKPAADNANADHTASTPAMPKVMSAGYQLPLSAKRAMPSPAPKKRYQAGPPITTPT